jgi:F0F1-type ATP synthase assembly protein I
VENDAHAMSKEADQNPNWGQYVGLGLEMAVGVGVGYAIGFWLDRKYGWGSRGATVGALLGIAAGMYLLIKQALKMNKD